ncbi:MAG: TIGR04283 family arsenosugar biosynthesis glycosyltransferase [Cycloclasticus sp.]
MFKISIVIPALNESGCIVDSLLALQGLRQQGVELIVVDGGSDDNTRDLAQPMVDLLLSSAAGRGRQMNVGAKRAEGCLLVFLHADCRLPDGAYQLLAKLSEGDHVWGRFDVRLDGSRRVFRLIETLMNWRSRLSGIMTGDQAIFVSARLFAKVAGFPEIPLMEDIALSRKLKRQNTAVCLHSRVLSSSRRWQQNGVLRTILLMWGLRLGYFFNVDPVRLAKKYRHDRG